MLIYCILLYMFLSMLNGVLQVPLRQPDGDVQTEATEAIKFLWWTGQGSWRMDENGRPWTFTFLSCRFTSPWKLLCNLHELKKSSTTPTDPTGPTALIKSSEISRVPLSCTDGSAMWEVMFLAHVAPSFPEKAKVVFPVFFALRMYGMPNRHTSYIIIHSRNFTQWLNVIRDQ